MALLPARLVMKLRRESSASKPHHRPLTDSVNPFRQQIYKSLVSVALKPQTAKPSSDECQFLIDRASAITGRREAFLYKQQSRRSLLSTRRLCVPLTGRLRVPLGRASLGIRTGSTCRSGFIPAAFRGHTRTTPVRPRNHTTSPAHFLWELKQLGDIRREPPGLVAFE